MEELATALHSLRCHHSHIDQCSWEYEGDDWSGGAHKYYLEKAEKLYGSVPQRPPAIIAVLQALENL